MGKKWVKSRIALSLYLQFFFLLFTLSTNFIYLNLVDLEGYFSKIKNWK